MAVAARRSSLPVRSSAELALMRRAGRVVAEIHETLKAAIRPGVTTAALDRLARQVLERRGATSNFLGYHGYPAVICASPNDVVIHGIPSDDVVLADGDVLSIDCGAIVGGWHGDAAFTVGVGEISQDAERLIATAWACLDAAIEVMRVGRHLSDVGHAVQTLAESRGYSVVREYTGHGIGRAMHEPPDVPNWGRPGRGPVLAAGNVLAVEPMVCAGARRLDELDDGWTVVTADGRLAAHVEHTIAVGEDGPEVLTQLA